MGSRTGSVTETDVSFGRYFHDGSDLYRVADTSRGFTDPSGARYSAMVLIENARDCQTEWVTVKEFLSRGLRVVRK